MTQPHRPVASELPVWTLFCWPHKAFDCLEKDGFPEQLAGVFRADLGRKPKGQGIFAFCYQPGLIVAQFGHPYYSTTRDRQSHIRKISLLAEADFNLEIAISKTTRASIHIGENLREVANRLKTLFADFLA